MSPATTKSTELRRIWLLQGALRWIAKRAELAGEMDCPPEYHIGAFRAIVADCAYAIELDARVVQQCSAVAAPEQPQAAPPMGATGSVNATPTEGKPKWPTQPSPQQTSLPL